MASKNPLLVAVRPNGQDDTPQFKLEIDDVRAGALGVSLADANSVLATASRTPRAGVSPASL